MLNDEKVGAAFVDDTSGQHVTRLYVWFVPTLGNTCGWWRTVHREDALHEVRERVVSDVARHPPHPQPGECGVGFRSLGLGVSGFGFGSLGRT